MEIALNPEDLRAEIIESAAQKIANDYMEERMPNLGARVEALLKDLVKTHCDDVVVPMIAEGIDSRLIQSTNEYGEKKGEAKTLTVYLVESANAYLHEMVDYQGNKPSGYGSAKQTRLVWLIDKHLQYRIQTAMEQAVAAIQKEIAPAIAETIKTQVDELTKRIVTKRR